MLQSESAPADPTNSLTAFTGSADTIGCTLLSASTSGRALFDMPQHIFISFSPSFRYQRFEASVQTLTDVIMERHVDVLLFLQSVGASADSAQGAVMPTWPCPSDQSRCGQANFIAQ